MKLILELLIEIYVRLLKILDIAFDGEIPQIPPQRIGRPPTDKRKMELSKIWESAYEEFGTLEYPGPDNNPRILEYFKKVSGGHKSDSIQWCAAGLNFALINAGYEGTGSPIARKFNGWGVKLEEPQKGCIVVMWRESRNSWQGHVTLFESWVDAEKTMFFGLGFNQQNKVGIDLFRTETVLSYRSPF